METANMHIPEKGLYYHYKHDPKDGFNDYAEEVLGVARHSEDESLFVIYRPLYQNTHLNNAAFYARPLDMFLEDVTVKGKTIPRFTRITDPKLIVKLEVIKKEMYGA